MKKAVMNVIFFSAGRKSKKQISKGKRVKDVAQRRSKEKADSVPDSKSKVVEREASPHVSHKQKDIVMASPPPVKQETEPEKKEIKVERTVLEEKMNKDRVVESTEIRRDLPKSYQREARKPSPDSSSDESAKAKSPARKRLVSASDHSSSESPPRRRSRSRERGKSASASPRRRKRSPSPVATKIHVGNLTRNVNKDHITEIFSIYGKVRHVEMPVNRNNLVLRNYAYVEYEGPIEAEKAVKHMDGGWIDGQEVQTKLVLPMKDRRRPSPGRFNPRNRRRSPPRPRQPQRGFNRRSRTPPRRRSPSPGARRRSPRRSRSPVRRRSRSPVRGNFRRRRGSVSTESSRSRSPVRRVGRQRSRSASVSRRRRFSRSSTSS